MFVSEWERCSPRVCWRGLMVNDVLPYWWRIMSYQELIACTVASLSTAWRPVVGHWLHTSPQSLLFQHVLDSLLHLLHRVLCCSFTCHVLHLGSLDCVNRGPFFFFFLSKLWKGLISRRGDWSDSRPVNTSLFSLTFLSHILPLQSLHLSLSLRNSVHLSVFMLFNIHTLPSISSLFPSVLFSAVTFTLVIWSSWLASLSIHSPLHFAHAYCPASGPHFPPPQPPPSRLPSISTSPPYFIYGNMLMGQTQVKIEYFSVRRGEKQKLK